MSQLSNIQGDRIAWRASIQQLPYPIDPASLTDWMWNAHCSRASSCCLLHPGRPKLHGHIRRVWVEAVCHHESFYSPFHAWATRRSYEENATRRFFNIKAVIQVAGRSRRMKLDNVRRNRVLVLIEWLIVRPIRVTDPRRTEMCHALRMIESRSRRNP